MKEIAVIIGRGEIDRPSRSVLPPISDRAAVALALAKFQEPIRAYSIDRDSQALYYAQAAGITNVSVLEKWQECQFDIALVGGGACGAVGDLLPAQLAQQQNATLLVEVLDIELAEDHLLVTRSLGRGAKEIWQVRGRAVLVISQEVARPPYVSQYQWQRAARSLAKEVSGKPVLTEERSGSWQPTRPRVKTGELAAKTQGSAMDRLQAHIGMDTAQAKSEHIIQADPATCASHLLRYLRHHGFIEGTKEEMSLVSSTSEKKETATQAKTAGRSRQRKRRGPRPVKKKL